MPRLNNGTELWRKLTEVAVYRIVSAGGSTSLSASATAGATVLSVSSTASFSNNDPLIISGDGGVELNATVTVGTASLPLLYKLGFAQSTANGTVSVYEAAKTVLGHVAEEGVSVSPTFTQTAIRSAIADLPIAYIGGSGEVSVSFGLLGFNILNWQTAFGIPESELGAGTSTDPYQGAFGGSTFGTQTTQCFRFTGSRHDGATVLIDLNDARVELSGSIPLNRTAPAPIPCTIKGTSMIIRHYS